MKTYKYILIPAILAVAIACDKEREVTYGPGEEIRFNARTNVQQTKADFPGTSDFAVSAFHTGGEGSYLYFNNVRVTYGSGKWNTAKPLYWPKAATEDGTYLEFRGYSPYNATDPWCTFPDKSTLSGAYSFLPGENPDLLYSDPVKMSPATPGEVNLTFRHALGQTVLSLGVERFDDSVEKGDYHGFNIYCKYTEKDSPTTELEEKSFVFLSGNYPYSYDGTETYNASEQAFDLKNPIQNIWYVEISNLAIHNLAWSGTLEMTPDGSKWATDNNVWSSPSDRQTLTLMSESDPFYFSPNTKGFQMPFGTYVVLPQDLQPVISSQKPHISMDITFLLFRAEDNAANDSETEGDTRSQIFDYRDIAQYVDKDDNTVDGQTRKAGVFKKWHSISAQREFPGGLVLDYGTAVVREDAKPLLSVTKSIDLPLYDSKTSNPRYLKMNTQTKYTITIDPAGQEIQFTPSIDNWVEKSAEEN